MSMHVSSAAALRGATALRRPRGLIGGLRADTPTGPAELVEKIAQAFEEFKAANDARLKEIEKRGAADTVTAEKVDRINAEITRLTTEFKAALAEIETKLGRPGLAGPPDRDTAAQLKAFNRTLKAHARGRSRPMPADADLAVYDAYCAAFDTAMRTDAKQFTTQVQNALSIGSDPDGGYLCPPEIDTAIDRVVTSMGSLRSLATVRTIGSSSFDKLAQTTGASAGGWGNERTAPSETGTPSLVKLSFVPGTLWAEPQVTTELLEDASFDVAGWLADEVGLTFVEQESTAFIVGNGLERPRGLLSYPTVANASYAWGSIGYIASGAASDFAASNPSDKLIDLVHALKRQYRGNANWMMNDATLAKIRKFKDGQGNYLWVPGLQQGQVGVLLGYPVATDDFMPDVNTDTFPIAFGDFRRAYLVVDRRGTVVLRDPYTNKPFVKFFTTRRVGGGVQNFEAFKLMKIATS